MKRSIVIAAALVSASSFAQVSFTGAYTQDFNTLAPSGLANPWVNNLPTASMPGWYSSQTTYDADDGTLPNPSQYSYGSTTSTERALGSLALPGAFFVYGMRLNNASGGTYNSLNLSYTGEQWRSGSIFSDLLMFEYSTNASSLFTGTWTPVAALNFNAVNFSGSGAINGNLAANQSFLASTMTGLNWLNGADMWVRWTHIGNQSRHGLAIDDIKLSGSTSPVPEPMTIILGIGAICLAMSRRKVIRTA
ncbi:MAG: hypothetical protein H7Y17_13725 [Chlorobia bacterium]|nr:hypothetical protein [Fimbriimonadaceae bacterium]